MMTQLAHALAAYRTGFIVFFTLLYISMFDLRPSLTWPQNPAIRNRTTVGRMSTMRAKYQEMLVFAPAQKSHASTLSLT